MKLPWLSMNPFVSNPRPIHVQSSCLESSGLSLPEFPRIEEASCPIPLGFAVATICSVLWPRTIKFEGLQIVESVVCLISWPLSSFILFLSSHSSLFLFPFSLFILSSCPCLTFYFQWHIFIPSIIPYIAQTGHDTITPYHSSIPSLYPTWGPRYLTFGLATSLFHWAVERVKQSSQPKRPNRTITLPTPQSKPSQYSF